MPASFKNGGCGYPTSETMHRFIYAGTLVLFAALPSCSALPNAYEARLAEHLTATGAKMYGAYWCPHCGAQKEYFGAVADQLPYVECDAEGYSAQSELCAEMGIEVYPTWIIDGQYYTGVQLPGKLAALSGFESDSDSEETSPLLEESAVSDDDSSAE